MSSRNNSWIDGTEVEYENRSIDLMSVSTLQELRYLMSRPLPVPFFKEDETHQISSCNPPTGGRDLFSKRQVLEISSPPVGGILSTDTEDETKNREHDGCRSCSSSSVCGENPLGNKEIWESREMS